MERVAIIAHLKEGNEQHAAELVRAGPPFDLGDTGIIRHGVYISVHEVVFVFEGHEVEWIVDQLIDDRFTTRFTARSSSGGRSSMDDRESRASGSAGSATRASPSRSQRVKGASHGRIVVGVDHSKGAKAALGSRLRRRGCDRRRSESSTPGSSATSALPASRDGCPQPAESSMTSQGRGPLSTKLEEVAADIDGVTIERRAEQGTPAEVLIEESRGADLLVVGSRGHGGFAQLLLGSVSQRCPRRAFFPVVIVRGTSANMEVRSINGHPP